MALHAQGGLGLAILSLSYCLLISVYSPVVGRALQSIHQSLVPLSP